MNEAEVCVTSLTVPGIDLYSTIHFFEQFSYMNQFLLGSCIHYNRHVLVLFFMLSSNVPIAQGTDSSSAKQAVKSSKILSARKYCIRN